MTAIVKSQQVGPIRSSDAVYFPGAVPADLVQRLVSEAHYGTGTPSGALTQDGATAPGTMRRSTTRQVTVEAMEELTAHLDPLAHQFATVHGWARWSVEKASVLEYGPGDHFVKHVDGQPDAKEDRIRRRLFSCVAFLGERGRDYEGGELVLFDRSGQPVTVTSAPGAVAFFRADMPHEVLPIENGTRLTVAAFFTRGWTLT